MKCLTWNLEWAQPASKRGQLIRQQIESLDPDVVRYANLKTPTCVLGDYNQRIPRAGQPVNVAQALTDTMSGAFRIATAGMKDSEGHHLIDHFAVSSGLSISITKIVSRFASDETRLSDHVGVEATLGI